jgi:hypothetical protein
VANVVSLWIATKKAVIVFSSAEKPFMFHVPCSHVSYK